MYLIDLPGLHTPFTLKYPVLHLHMLDVHISLGPAQATVSLQATPGAASLVVKTHIQVRT